MRDLTDYSLLGHNTFGMDVSARRFVEYDTEDELISLLGSLTETDRPILHIGGGSNLLFLKDFSGTVLHSAIRDVRVTEEDAQGVTVRVGAGVVWDVFVELAVASGWYGAENLSLIPGEVGASAVQNIGAYGAEVGDLIRTVETVDMSTGDRRSFDVDECKYAYRSSIFKHALRGRYAVTYVTYHLGKTPSFRLDYGNVRQELERQGLEPSLMNIRKVVTDIRRSKLPDPKEMGNAGSFFMNPVIDRSYFEALQGRYPDIPHYPAPDGKVKVPAGWLIDRCGWRGRSLGRAGVHDRQALVLVNRGGATGGDIMSLASAVVEAVQVEFGITIRPEVNVIG